MYWIYLFCACVGIYRGLKKDCIVLNNNTNKLDYFEWLYIK